MTTQAHCDHKWQLVRTHASSRNAPKGLRFCSERIQGNNSGVRREGRLILLRMSVGGRPYNSAGMGTSMGMGHGHG